MKNRRVLVIEDDAELAEELAGLLRAEGYSVDAAFDGPSGLALAARRRYSLFLLDFKVGGMDGLKLVPALRRTHLAAPVVLISGRPGVAEEFGRANLAGEVVCFLEKPFDPRALLEKLAWLEAAR